MLYYTPVHFIFQILYSTIVKKPKHNTIIFIKSQPSSFRLVFFNKPHFYGLGKEEISQYHYK